VGKMVEINFQAIEKKWQKRWEKEKVFEAEVDKREKFYLNFPYPYINAYQHIGHLYTLMRVEVFARYKRLKGFNVLFPQAWHATGSPIVNAAKRVKSNEPKQIKIMKDMGIEGKELKKFEDPKYWIKFFAPQCKKDYKTIGMSIDWRREFITTSLNKYYDKFIQWQFRKLKKKNYCVKGKFPVVWDPKEGMAVGDHDRIEGEGEIPQEFYLFKFPLSDGRNIVTATLRPDTSLGITNIYVNPEVEYSEIEVDGEKWIVGKESVEKLKNQDFNVKGVSSVNGIELIGKKVESFGEKKILILPATFLDPNYGTGMVHSVPSDSADDLIALKDFQKDERLIKKYGLGIKEVRAIGPIEIFETPGVGGNSAQFFLDKYDVKSQNDRDKLDKIKKELYKLTFTKSKFGKLYRKGFSKNLEGMSISEGQIVIKKDLLKSKRIEVYYELTGKVISRSLTECVVKVVDDQWFIDYGNPEWKKKVHECLEQVRLYPEKVRQQFNYVIDWLHEWACTREEGLGTRLPWDDKWLIESLSDSTIYMAYYTIAHMIKDIELEKINDEFFDYIFLAKGEKPKIKGVDKIRETFEYWYPVDFRNSGKDLVQNHLTFFMFNHTAIFGKKHWPKGIGVNGWVTVDGRKMSKSLGNMIPLREMSKKFGSDVSRITILNGGEGLEDPNWESDFAESMKVKLMNLYEFSVKNYGKGRRERKSIDDWMDVELGKIIDDSESLMDETLFRSAIQKVYFDLQGKLKWYLRRCGGKPNRDTIGRFIEVQVLLLSPFTPFICEEIWSKIGKKVFISKEKWPNFKKIEYKGNEDYIKKVMEDSKAILNIVNSGAKKVYLYCIPPEFKLLEEAMDFFSEEFGLKFEVFAVNDKDKYDPQGKSKKVKPGRPGIYVE
jgi:leucyl-tRNA synthetase